MKIQLNGKELNIQNNISILELLSSLQHDNKKIAIELNSNIIPKHKYNETFLKNEDVVEIVSAIGGG
ncbi:sulfur carrier protein ThiS [Candidatus Kinetoplastidibacterium crithidiae]|uniref:Sulfur carrier protein ThiS n=1 Tax=Candidatus Kinetoplastidibacterium crithidiae TCC036E TaxID=1208918 RepID=M1L3R6_9PROT|nr:sulfur carrier protein ThiS [Candidatus Kinetoplastibacterium crithidii]AGF47383.1 sulfur carrier protein ThiS [Candidatus Kinetoplastibacterium crithidii TCC036E]